MSSLAIKDPFSDDAVRLAAGCADCTIMHRAKLRLPLSGVGAISAKLGQIDAAGRFQTREVTVRADGVVVQETVLLAAEQAERRKRFGKLTPQLHAMKGAPPASENIDVSIWLNAPQTYPRKEDLLADKAAMTAHTAATTAR
jgi:hypothetical protein